MVGQACGDETVHGSAGLGTSRGSAKEPVLSANGEGSDGTFCQIIGNAAISVVDVVRQFLTMAKHIGDGVMQS